MREMGPTACRRGLVASSPPTPQYSLDGRWGGVENSLDGRWRDVMTVVSGRGAHVLLLEAATVMSLLGRALLLVILFFLKKVMQEVVQVKLLV